MAEELTQQQIEADRRAYEDQREADRRAYEDQREATRFENEMVKEEKRIRLEVVRLAKETLIENSRSKAVDERDVSAEDITTFADVLYEYTKQ
jgi:hypothetical protein